MALDPATDLVAFIANASPFTSGDLVVDSDIFIGQPRVVRAETPSRAVFVDEQRGPKPDPYLGISQDFKRFQIDITVRSNPGEYFEGGQLAREIMDAVHRKTPAGYLTALLQQSGPEFRGESNEREYFFGFLVELWWKG